MITLCLLFLPFFSGILCFALPKTSVKYFAFISSLVSLGITIIACIQRDQIAEKLHFNAVWVESLGIQFKLGIDGISLLMILLTNLLIPFILASSFKNTYPRIKLFYFLILFMQTGLLGVFMALDGFFFYIFWEIALIPIYFICGLWGGAERAKVTLKFFIYTILGSLFMLMGILFLYLKTPNHSFDLEQFYALNLSNSVQTFVFLSFFIAFAIKVPIFPFHTWQPDTYTVAPTEGSMLLGGIMLKMGLYGLIRWLMPICPHALDAFTPVLVLLGVIGVVYASIIALTQTDLKRLVAYSSIAHVGLIVTAFFVNNLFGMQGGLIQMLSHGINLVGLFFIISIIQRETGTRELGHLGGIAKKAPVLATCFLIILLGSIALPLTDGFVGEFLMLNGILQYNLYLSLFAGSTLILGAVYMLRFYQKTMLGEPGTHVKHFEDIKGWDRGVLFGIVILVLVLGVYSNPILKMTEPSVTKILLGINTKLIAR